MPTTRRRRTRNLVPGLTPFQRAWFLDMALPEPDADDTWWRIVTRCHEGGPNNEGVLWAENRDELMHAWLVVNPGRRPACWWRYDAPRQPVGTFPGRFYDGLLPLPRERLGGVGMPRHDFLALMPRWHLGIPVEWISERDLDTWPSLVGQGAVPLDPNNPPVFEAQAVYLKRLGLLLPGEARRVKPADFAPELATLDEEVVTQVTALATAQGLGAGNGRVH